MPHRRGAGVPTDALVPDRTSYNSIKSVYDKAGAAVKRKDLKALVALLTADATSIGLDGAVNSRAEWEEDLGKDAAAVGSFDQANYQIDKLSVKGDEAVAYLTESFTGTLIGSGSKFSSTVVCRDVLVRVPEGWRVRVSETIRSTVEVDGKRTDSSANTREAI